jgi:histone-lysine N-methyltransferase SETMAR
MGTLLLRFQQLRSGLPGFKRGRTSLEDDPREGHPKSATPLEIMEQVHNVVLDDWQIKVREIAETTGNSKECVGYILHEELDMIEPCARWVPCLLTADKKRTRMKISGQCLERFNKNNTDFMRRLINLDENWIHHYTPESKQQSKQWTEAGCSVPKKTSSVPSAGKVMVSVFWDAEGILFVDYLEKGKTITGEYYSNLLTRLDKKNHKKRPGLQTKVFWQWENQGICTMTCWNIHPIPQIWLSLTSISSQNSNSSSLVSVFLQINR